MKEVTSYNTIAQPVESLFKDKGSKFLGFAYPVNNEEDIRVHLEYLKELHPKATHHCYAWRLGTDDYHYRANDDGEPSGTAGKPILGQIDAAGLTNCLVVSVRYFGGTKLGVPGLIAAYKASARLTLEATEIVTKIIMHSYKIQCGYESLNKAYQWIQIHQGIVAGQELTDTCIVYASIPAEHSIRAREAADQYYPLIIEYIEA